MSALVASADVYGFVLVAFVVTITPGPDMVLVARHAVGSGRRAGLLAAFGVCSGLLIHAIAAAAGLSTVIATSATAFTVVKLAGAAYLAVLGVRALWRSVRGVATPPNWERGDRSRNAYREGLLTNVLNPKVALVFLALMPSFIDATEPAVAQVAMLALAYLVLGFVWLTSYALILASIGPRLLAGWRTRALDAISGTVLMGLGLRLAITER